MNRVLVAMSGGVDSSVAAFLLREAGYDVVGVTMCLGIRESADARRPACCGPDAVLDAERVAGALSIPHYVLDFAAEFQANVVDKFVGEYRSGRTPNPCVDCNRFLKFDTLLARALGLGFTALATGHYAGIRQRDGRYLLTRPKDHRKDQTYFLAGIPREALSHIIFPLAPVDKDGVRKIAKKAGLPVAEKPESQDICFIPDGDYGAFIAKRTIEISPGPIVDTDGRTLGTHRGIPFYTVGQRGGLGIAARTPLYVIRIETEDNTVVIGSREHLLTPGLICSNVNVLVDDLPEAASVKIRSTKPDTPCRIIQNDDGTVRVIFDRPQEAVTPGQAAVFYSDDVVLGGGTIDRVINEDDEDLQRKDRLPLHQ
ncbi:MAG: tRNA 2-thiouridine(34) synthase MnmA [Deltaproteobacteria bacterium]|nr:tRNA 2-thiouridine(34) synthase MnmA [Candidatus Zymogenaceae bacterium]